MGYGGSGGWDCGKTLLADATQIYARVLIPELLGPRTEGCLVGVTQVQGQLEALGQVCQVSIGPSGGRSGPPAAFQEVARGEGRVRPREPATRRQGQRQQPSQDWPCKHLVTPWWRGPRGIGQPCGRGWRLRRRHGGPSRWPAAPPRGFLGPGHRWIA